MTKPKGAMGVEAARAGNANQSIASFMGDALSDYTDRMNNSQPKPPKKEEPKQEEKQVDVNSPGKPFDGGVKQDLLKMLIEGGVAVSSAGDDIITFELQGQKLCIVPSEDK